jgi:hypothetical protein
MVCGGMSGPFWLSAPSGPISVISTAQYSRELAYNLAALVTAVDLEWVWTIFDWFKAISSPIDGDFGECARTDCNLQGKHTFSTNTSIVFRESIGHLWPSFLIPLREKAPSAPVVHRELNLGQPCQWEGDRRVARKIIRILVVDTFFLRQYGVFQSVSIFSNSWISFLFQIISMIHLRIVFIFWFFWVEVACFLFSQVGNFSSAQSGISAADAVPARVRLQLV